MAMGTSRGRPSLGFILRTVRSWRRDVSPPCCIHMVFAWLVGETHEEGGIFSFGKVGQRWHGSQDHCFAPGDRVEHGMTFSIIGVVSTTKLILGTLCYSSRIPSSHVAGSAHASLPNHAAGGESWAPCLGKQPSARSPHPQGTTRL